MATGSRRSSGARTSRRSSSSTPGSTAGRTSTTTGARVADYLARYDGTVSVNVGTLVGNSQLRIAALGWDDVPADAKALDRMRAMLRDAMAEGAVGLSTGPRLPARQLRHDRGARRPDPHGRRARRLLPHPRPLPARRPLPRPVQGGDRDRAPRRRAQPTSPTSITARPIPAARSRCSPSSTTPAPRASTSPSTSTPPSGPARACSSSSRSGSRPAAPVRSRQRLADRARPRPAPHAR